MKNKVIDLILLVLLILSGCNTQQLLAIADIEAHMKVLYAENLALLETPEQRQNIRSIWKVVIKNVWKWLKRRTAIEPTIGHLKDNKRLDRNRLKGSLGDTLNVLFSAASTKIAANDYQTHSRRQ